MMQHCFFYNVVHYIGKRASVETQADILLLLDSGLDVEHHFVHRHKSLLLTVTREFQVSTSLNRNR